MKTYLQTGGWQRHRGKILNEFQKDKGTYVDANSWQSIPSPLSLQINIGCFLSSQSMGDAHIFHLLLFPKLFFKQDFYKN